MSRPTRPVLVVAAATVVASAAALLLVRPGPAAGLIRTITGGRAAPEATTVRGGAGTRSAVESAAAFFLDRYERPAGQVVRSDQGGDTVSEGEAYAMLVAVATGDRSRFSAAWSWSQAHLMEPDGLLAWRYSGGQVADPEPAADADLLAAWALDLAAGRFDSSGYRRAAARLSAAVLGHEVETVSGRAVLLAGPWARGAAPLTSPSYLAPAPMRTLAALDGRWSGVAASSEILLGQLLQGGHLPSDWAVVTPAGTAHPTTPPGQPGSAVVYGYDAVRLPVFLASSCQPDEVGLAASLWPVLDRDVSEGRPLVGLDLGGSPSSGAAVDPVAEVGAAATAMAAGHVAPARRLLDLAQYSNGVSPTYFGSAWVALGRLLLQSSALGSCSGRPG